MRVYVDATTLISLGNVEELGLLTNFNGEPVVLPAVAEEVTTEPARTNVERFVEREGVSTDDPTHEEYVDEATEILGESEENGDVQIVAAVLAREEAAVVSDDRRVRTVCDGLGVTVTGTVGVVVRAVEEGMSAEKAKDVVRRVDGHGLHMTAELRETAYDLIEERA
jgi:predicted nucleic acid-binding protein